MTQSNCTFCLNHEERIRKLEKAGVGLGSNETLPYTFDCEGCGRQLTGLALGIRESSSGSVEFVTSSNFVPQEASP